MNAYELADQVEMWGEDLLALNMKGGIPVVQGAKMLRQQADRISVLEANDEIQLNIVKKQQDYIDQLEQGLRASIELNKAQAERQVKELTNMEIMDIGDKYLVSAFIPSEALEFARAILRKAQE
jgi:hypothetical protein